jgi:hypothetical protein
MRFSSALLFLSEFELNIAQKIYQIDKKKIKFINNGVDEEFHKNQVIGKENKTPSLVFIGDSERKDKDFNFLYSNLDRVNQKCDLFVVGKFNTNEYENKIGNVSIISVNKMDRDSLINFLIDKDIFISSSFYDTFSIAAGECMTLGAGSGSN